MIKGEIMGLEMKVELLEKEKILASRLHEEKYLKIKEKYLEGARCELCNTPIGEQWEDRLKKGCPVCGTSWQYLQKDLKEKIKDLEDLAGVPEGSLEKELENTKDLLESKRLELDVLLKKFEKIDEEIRELKERQNEIIKKRKALHSKLNEVNGKINNIHSRIGETRNKMDILSKYGSIEYIRKKKEEIETEIEKIENMLEHYTAQLPEEKEIQKIIRIFAESSNMLFGYEITYDHHTNKIKILKDKSERFFESLSWGEKYFIDVLLKISIWEFLIKNGVARKGMLIIDSPEAALDHKRLELLARLFNEKSKIIDIIVTTRDERFYNLLKGNDLKIKKRYQTSLFDFATT